MCLFDRLTAKEKKILLLQGLPEFIEYRVGKQTALESSAADSLKTISISGTIAVICSGTITSQWHKSKENQQISCFGFEGLLLPTTPSGQRAVRKPGTTAQ